jgi:acetyl-CoA acetyltransferase
VNVGKFSEQAGGKKLVRGSGSLAAISDALTRARARLEALKLNRKGEDEENQG